jgi:UDPglucose 6-dehydrogenase
MGHEVVGHDADPEQVAMLAAGDLPVQEPGLEVLLREGIAAGRLRFTSDLDDVAECRVLWVTHDTPVDSADRGLPDSVVAATIAFFPHLRPGSVVVVSAQLPVGSTRRLDTSFRQSRPEASVAFAYSPENLRLGTAIDSFMRPERIVVGVEDPDGRATIESLVAPLGSPIEWMSLEAAEMTKHALNAFLATSVVFANEIAAVCESVGADVVDVMRALRADPRIGQRAYLGVGTGYAGGTLGRDVTYLTDLATARAIEAPLLTSIAPSNRHQQQWVRRTIERLLGQLSGARIGIWGLTYKVGTDTLRRSAAIELCEWLLQQGAVPVAHDPAVRALPAELAPRLALQPDPLTAARGADALIVMTPWPEYRAVPIQSLVAEMKHPLIVDPGRLLADTAAIDPRVRYAAVGLSRA